MSIRMAARGPASPADGRHPVVALGSSVRTERKRRGRIRGGWMGGPGHQMFAKLKPWLLTFVGVAVSLAIINRVPMVRNLVYGAPQA